MARSRNIKPGFFKNDALAECSPWARLCFAGLWTLADRAGRLEDRPKRIKGELFAFDSVEVEALLQELAEQGFILRYTVGSRALIQVVNFERHQNPHHKEAKSILPAPPGWVSPKQNQDSEPEDEPTALDKPEASPGQAPDKPEASPSVAVLIPDSLNLIPDSLHKDAAASAPADPPRKAKRRKSSEGVTLATYLSSRKAANLPPFDESNAASNYADSIALPDEFLQLAWREFKVRHTTGTSKNKCQLDWAATFANYLRNNYLKLWWVNGGTYELTTQGRQAQLAAENARAAA